MGPMGPSGLGPWALWAPWALAQITKTQAISYCVTEHCFVSGILGVRKNRLLLNIDVFFEMFAILADVDLNSRLVIYKMAI